VISNQVLQADIIADLKALAALTTLLKAATDIKEDQYQGTVYGYPAVRVALARQVPYRIPELCDHMTLTFSIRVYSEQESSKEADTVMGVIAAHYHRHFFSGTGWKGWINREAVVSAALWSEKLWRAEAFFRVNVYPNAATA
jgi:hypothetical protein